MLGLARPFLRSILNPVRPIFKAIGMCVLLTLGLSGSCWAALSGSAPALPELTNAAQIRSLPPKEASRHYPVHLRGVVTFFDQKEFLRFVQDSSGGIYFYMGENMANAHPDLKAGMLIDIVGQSSQGEYAPIVEPRRVEILGPAPSFPKAKPVPVEQLSSGQEDSQFVKVSGIVRVVRYDEKRHYYLVDIVTGGDRFTAVAAWLPGRPGADLVDSTVIVRGVCLTSFNRQRQLFNARLLVPRPEDLQIQKPAPSAAGEIPVRPISSLLQFSPQGTYGHRVRVKGTVIYRQDPNTLYIEDDTSGLFVETAQPGKLLVGDEVEITGFAARGDYTPLLQDAAFRRLGGGALPHPDEITADQALQGSHDCRLVQIEAAVLDRGRNNQEQFLVLASGHTIFQAYLERKTGVDFAYLENGSRIAVTGVCLVEPGLDWAAGEAWRAKSFRVLMRSAGDINVIQAVSWWNLRKVFWLMGILGFVLLVAMAWVAVLRRRVSVQTKIISQKLEMVATLKERYQALFENANDMVYTHDLRGRITSINQTGEELLQRSREQLLNRNILDFVADDDKAAARQWLEQIAQGATSSNAEWDFISAQGNRVRLEISARLIGQPGNVEIEGTARDITERKRLEREILEISNREQRRIGHDLHDGVCQQLAGIALMTASLADQLEEKGAPEAPQTERISGLINHVISQTRGVARGLFPVRLEANGLVSALEELAVNSSELFKTNCQFICRDAPEAVDNQIALHLYYIVLEAVANACKHGRARNVSITLERRGERYALRVEDDGAGFLVSDRPHTGMGIRIMQYRARVIGANLNLRSEPGSGTHLTCWFYAVSREERSEPGNGHSREAEIPAYERIVRAEEPHFDRR